jgi:hypothetical protein
MSEFDWLGWMMDCLLMWWIISDEYRIQELESKQ